MNRLKIEHRAQILALLVEGNSVSAAARIADVSKVTVLKLLADAGKACAEYQDHAFRNLSCRRLQADEIWSFIHSKEKNVSDENKGKLGHGDTWVWTVIDSDTKLIPCWRVGRRNAETAREFIADLASRLTHRVQLTTDGFVPYIDAVERAFGSEVDYSMLVKIYGPEPEQQKRYSPSEFVGTKKCISLAIHAWRVFRRAMRSGAI